jgi:protein O-mannosyl-transferase
VPSDTLTGSPLGVKARSSRWLPSLALGTVLLVAITLGVYANSLLGGFVWDDVPIVVESQFGSEPRRLAEVLLSPDEVKPYYRPLNRASYVLDARVWGANPMGFHGVNVALHAANVVALFFLLQLLFRRRALALGAALLLAVHPINAETVDFISARNNLFALLFLLAAIAFLALGLRSRSRLAMWGSGFAWFLALSSKDSAATGLVLLVAYAFWPVLPSARPLRARLLALIPHAVFLAAYLGLRHVALEGLMGTPVAIGSIGEALRQNYFIVPRYLELVLFPVRMNVFHPVPPGSVAHAPWLLLAWAAIVAGIIALVRQRSLPSLVGLAWFAVNFLPIANLVPIPSAAMAERFLYLPAVGLWLIAADQALRLRDLFPRKAWATAILALPVVALAGGTVRRNADWRDDVTLFRSSLEVEPRSVIALFNLGSALRDRGDLEGARAAWERALEIDPRDAGSLAQLGTLAAVTGDYPRAERLFRAAQDADPRNALVHLNLAKLFEKTGRPGPAAMEYGRFLELATRDQEDHVAAARAARDRLVGSGAGAH